ncbi:MAG: biotin--[acetyl-CoA-carboxylase] ligase [Gammaproteobacteria bacterium]
MAVDGVQRRLALVQALADGAWHSGETIAEAMGVSRTAVWKHAAHLPDWGLELESAAGQGYRLRGALSLLNEAELRAALPPATRAELRELQIAAELPSTNAALLERTPATLPPGQFDLCLAEFQTAGRGRRGRNWVSPFASGLCFSLAWAFAELPAGIGALSLATGVAVRRALMTLGTADRVQLKWPNDLLVDGRKLGGILLELRAEAGGPAYVVIGIGLNLDLPPETRAAIARERAESGGQGLEVTDLAEVMDGVSPSRSLLAATLTAELHAMLVQFTREGFAPFHAEWSAADALRGQRVRWLAGTEPREGVAAGIAEDGALLVDTAPGRRESVHAGEVMQVRPA